MSIDSLSVLSEALDFLSGLCIIFTFSYYAIERVTVLALSSCSISSSIVSRRCSALGRGSELPFGDQVQQVEVQAPSCDELEAREQPQNSADPRATEPEEAPEKVSREGPEQHSDDRSARGNQELVPVIGDVTIPGVPGATLHAGGAATRGRPEPPDGVGERGQRRNDAPKDGSRLADEFGGPIPEAGQDGQEPAGGEHVGNQEQL